MSGHSKWASIKHKKGALDAKRGKLFSKLVKEITVLARRGGGNIEQNPSLRLVVQKAKEANMPADNIDRAVKRGTGELPGVVYEEIFYEGYGSGGVAVLVEALTDNKNRTTGEVRNIFDKNSGNMAGQGSVSWQFSKKGFIVVSKDNAEEEKLMDLAVDAGAEDFKVECKSYEITTEVNDFENVKKAIQDAKIQTESAEVTMIPSSQVKIHGDDQKKTLRLIDALEDNDDVQNVYANFDISDEDLEKES